MHASDECGKLLREEGASGFAWNHGDFQNDITHTWLGVVGPGVKHKGRFGELFTDHTDIRPTILSVAHLKDDYSHDGRTVFEILDEGYRAGWPSRVISDTLSAWRRPTSRSTLRADCSASER